MSPFLYATPSIRTPCARTAPSASSIGVKPNFMPQRSQYATAFCAAMRRGERGARVDDRDVKPRDSRDRRQRLRNVHSPDEGETRPRGLNGQKIVFALVRDGCAFTHAQGSFQLRGERIRIDRFGANE